MEIAEPLDPNFKDNYLCNSLYQPKRYPNWPSDFFWITQRRFMLDGYNCLQVNEPLEGSSWADNYLCVKSGSGIIDMKWKWSYSGEKFKNCFNINILGSRFS